jgi:hypothetical protein
MTVHENAELAQIIPGLPKNENASLTWSLLPFPTIETAGKMGLPEFALALDVSHVTMPEAKDTGPGQDDCVALGSPAFGVIFPWSVVEVMIPGVVLGRLLERLPNFRTGELL